MNSKKLFFELFSWIKALGIALIIVFFINVFFFQSYKVYGSSMEPTFIGDDLLEEKNNGDRVMAFKITYKLGSQPKFGDIIIIDSRVEHNRTLIDDILDSPIGSLFTSSEQSEHHYWVKRVIGEPGDSLEYKDGHVYRNGEILKEDYIKEEMKDPFETIIIPENHVFVMGDNRNRSIDSREIGPVAIDNVIGKISLRYYPFGQIKTF